MNRLKELLFDGEQQTLADMQARIEQLAESDRRLSNELLERLAELAENERRGRQELAAQLDHVARRAGSEEKFRDSVAEVLDGAMRQAEGQRHSELSDAMSPMVVRTVKTELRNSQDELVQALYPMTGRMVQAYVASAMKDLADNINRRLEQNALMLRFRSWTTGRSMADVALADAQWPEVQELYLIRRGTGELVQRWPAGVPGSNLDHTVGGVLTAINEFAREAFAAEAASLRQIDIGDSQIYLRASPGFLLAAKLKGTSPVSVEQIVDEGFLGTMERHGDALGAHQTDAGPDTPLLADLAAKFSDDIEKRRAALALPPLGFKPLIALACAILLPLLAWYGWGLYVDYETARARTKAQAAIASVPALRGFNLELAVAPRGREITISGLVPSRDAGDLATSRVRDALPDALVRLLLAYLPAGQSDPTPRIATLEARLEDARGDLRRELAQAKDAVRRDLNDLDARVSGDVDRVRNTLDGALGGLKSDLRRQAEERDLRRALQAVEAAGADVGQVAAAGQGLPGRARVETSRMVLAELADSMRSGLEALAVSSGGGEGAAFDGLMADWRKRRAEETVVLSTLLGAPGAAPAGLAASRRPGDGRDGQSVEVAAQALRLADVAAALAQSNALRLEIPAAPGPLSPRERLEAFARANAIFFASDTAYRDTDAAAETLDRLARLMRGSDLLVRIVGYTDNRGGAQRNSELAEARAARVRDDLIARGVPGDRIVAVGRPDGVSLSDAVGETSPNRRVEFEVGFEGEVPR